MTRKNYSTADFIMEQLSLEELGLITGGVMFDIACSGRGTMAASPNDIPKDGPYF